MKIYRNREILSSLRPAVHDEPQAAQPNESSSSITFVFQANRYTYSLGNRKTFCQLMEENLSAEIDDFSNVTLLNQGRVLDVNQIPEELGNFATSPIVHVIRRRINNRHMEISDKINGFSLISHLCVFVLFICVISAYKADPAVLPAKPFSVFLVFSLIWIVFFAKVLARLVTEQEVCWT